MNPWIVSALAVMLVGSNVVLAMPDIAGLYRCVDESEKRVGELVIAPFEREQSRPGSTEAPVNALTIEPIEWPELLGKAMYSQMECRNQETSFLVGQHGETLTNRFKCSSEQIGFATSYASAGPSLLRTRRSLVILKTGEAQIRIESKSMLSMGSQVERNDFILSCQKI